ncbi:MAG TPA: ATP-dependent RNA helicase DbpA [Kiritimatiellia bacterium]|nr:ATP-dependent RNA helicase DbpA [Kiritimatiellia bacterium]
MTESFSKLDLSSQQLGNLKSLGFEHMTPIQAAALPPVLHGKDVLAKAKTGSGKTAVFALGILARLKQDTPDVQALVLCPTRELCLQITGEIRRMARHMPNIKVIPVYGGQPLGPQKQSLKHGAHVVVGTPGRVKDLLGKGALKLTSVSVVVLDEVDRMLEMGFIDDVSEIVQATPTRRQTLLFSATVPEHVEKLSRQFQRRPESLAVDERHTAGDIEQRVIVFPEEAGRLKVLLDVLGSEKSASVVVFCNFKQTTWDVCERLNRSGLPARALNGEMEQREREEALIQFKQQSISVLVATDVAARGLDIQALPLVINYELPPDPEVYVHRIGRTGRAGLSGKSISICRPGEMDKIKRIEEYLSMGIPATKRENVPTARHDFPEPPFVTICIHGGRKDKLRPGELLGTLTADGGVAGSAVGKIDVLDHTSYVAVKRSAAARAEQKLKTSKIKGRSYKIRVL